MGVNQANPSSNSIGAVILGSGLSRRMGTPKLILPWGDTTVIGQIIRTLKQAGVFSIVLTTGGARVEVENAVKDLNVITAFNPDFASGEMISSLQTGLLQTPSKCSAIFIVLGDQPQIEAGVLKVLIDQYDQHPDQIIIPSYQMKRGHPWIVPRIFWGDLLTLTPPSTMRDFLDAMQDKIIHIPVDFPGILKDLDTPEDYQSQKPVKRW